MEFPLRSLLNLQTLHVNNTSITDQGIAVLHGLPKLQLLNVSCTEVTDNGLAAFLSLEVFQPSPPFALTAKNSSYSLLRGGWRGKVHVGVGFAFKALRRGDRKNPAVGLLDRAYRISQIHAKTPCQLLSATDQSACRLPYIGAENSGVVNPTPFRAELSPASTKTAPPI